MLKQLVFVLSCVLLLGGCPEDPIQNDPVGEPPKENTTALDAGTTAPNPPTTDAGVSPSPPPPIDAGLSNPVNDAGTTNTTPSDAGYTNTPPSDAGNNLPPLLQGDAGLLDIPMLSEDGGIVTPDAFLYIRNIYLSSGENGFVEVMINSDEPIGGLQFMITGVTTVPGSTSGGLVESTNGFTGTITAAGQFLSFTMTSDTLPPHNGPLVEIPISAITEGSICITDVVISDATGTQLLGYAECKPAP